MLVACLITLILTAIEKNSSHRTVQLITSSCLIVLFLTHMWLIKQLWLSALPNLDVIKYLAVNYTLKSLLILGTTLYFLLVRQWFQNIGNIVYLFFLSTSVYIAYHFYLKVSAAQETQSQINTKLIASEENLITYREVSTTFENTNNEKKSDAINP